MNKLIQYIESNLERFSNMEEDEVMELDAHYMDDDIVEYLKGTNQYMYKDICMLYGEGANWAFNVVDVVLTALFCCTKLTLLDGS